MTKRLGSWQRCTRMARRRAVSAWRPTQKDGSSNKPEQDEGQRG